MSDVALRFGAKDDGLDAQFRRVNKSLDDLQGRTSKASSAISSSFTKIGAAVAAIGFTALVRQALEFADELEKASARTGIAVEGLQKLQFIANQTSGDIGTITNAISRMQVQLAAVDEGSTDATKALARLQIPIGQFVGLAPDQQFQKVAVAIANIQDPAQRTAAAVGLFGKSGAELLPVLVSTGLELDKVTAQFEAIGGPVSQKTVDQVDEIGDSFGRLKISTRSLVTELAALAQPLLTPLVDSIAEGIASFRLLSENADVLAKITQNIRFLKEERDTGVVAVGKSLFNPEGGVSFLSTSEIDHQIASLDRMREHILQLRQAPELKPITLDQSLLKIPELPDPDQLTPQEKRQRSLGDNNPVVIAALEEKDLLLKINQDKLDQQLVQESAASIARINLSGDTQATLLDAADAFTGQIINFAQLRSDFEQNASLATLGVVGQALSVSFQKNKTMQIALATIATISGVARALSEYPYPYSLVIGAAVAASGAAQIARIKSTNFNSSGSTSAALSAGASGGGAASGAVTRNPISAPPTGLQQRPVAQITINGPITGEASMRWLVDRLRESIGDFDLVLTRT